MMKIVPCSLALLITAAACLQADVVVTKDGSRLTGEITLIDQGTIHMKTAFAGAIKISQDQVASFQTEEPVVVRLQSGTVMSGPVELSGDGKLKIASEDGVLETSTAKVAASWSPGTEDPEVVRNRREWEYNASLNLSGETGNTEEFDLGAKLQARLKGPNDTLGLYIEYEQGEEEGLKTDDRIEGGGGYETFVSDEVGWYVRTELEQDRIDEINLRSLSSGGLSYRFINKPHQTLIMRNGLGYEFTSYSNNTEDDSSATYELAFNHSYRHKDFFRIQSELVYIPLLSGPSDFRLEHDTAIIIPIGRSENWSIALGIENEYESEPATDEKLDTTYYTRMIYSWD